MTMVRGTTELYQDDQIVVALIDRRLVDQTLAQWRIGFHYVEQHHVLGLGLVSLDLASVGRAVNDMASDPQIGPGLAAYRTTLASRPGQPPVTSVDLLLKALRLTFSERYPNWEGPRIGKNRGIDTLSGAPEIGPGQVGDPLQAETPLPSRFPQTDGSRGRLTTDTSGHGVKVGQIDGPMYDHDWLGGGYWADPPDQIGRNMGEYQVNQGHATSVATCILQLAPAAKIHLGRVLHAGGIGNVWDAATKMIELADLECDVVNVSVGQCFCDDGQPPLVLDTAVRRLSARSVIIAAAGNHGNINDYPCLAKPGLTPTSVYYPAGCDDVIAVGALDQDGKVADFTPKDAPYIRLMAPGTGVTVAYPEGQVTIQHHCQDLVKKVPFRGWATVSGTSFSAAIVTGEIARRTNSGKSARQALEELLMAQNPIPVPNPSGGFIQPA